MSNVVFEVVPEEKTQENFRRLATYLDTDLFQGMFLAEFSFGKNETDLVIPHGLNFAPRDIILTERTGTGTFTVDQNKTTRTTITVSTTAACNVRIIIGTLGSVQ